MKRKIVICLFLLVSMLIFLEISLFFVRAFSERQLDDLTPRIECDKELIEKSDRLFVVPEFENSSISENMTWCAEVLNTGKKLEMHGVYHTYKEFLEDRDESYVNSGIAEFEKCFGFSPEGFKAPQLALSLENKKMLEKKGIKVSSSFGQITHKVYHCDDSGLLPNSFIDVF